MKKWEYYIVDIHSRRESDINEHLNGLGKAGWELVSLAPYLTGMTVYMKRPLSESGA